MSTASGGDAPLRPAVRPSAVVLPIAVPGPSLLPTVAVYLLLGVFLPQSDEF